MKIAVISDIHGNYLALEAVLSDIKAQKVDDILNLGDHLSGPLDAKYTATRLINSTIISIAGNHDRNLIEQKIEDMCKSDEAAHSQLFMQHINWLKDLEATHVYHEQMFMCHGTAKDDSVYWMEEVLADGRVCQATQDQIEDHAKGLAYPILLCGHSHVARMVRLKDGRILVNPGSVGLPAYDDDTPVAHIMQSCTPKASYALLERVQSGWQVEQRYVNYDHHTTADKASLAGREDWAHAIRTGWFKD